MKSGVDLFINVSLRYSAPIRDVQISTNTSRYLKALSTQFAQSPQTTKTSFSTYSTQAIALPTSIILPESMATPNPNTIPRPEALNPDSIDTLPVLAEILSRLQNLSSDTTTGATPSTTPSQGVASTGVITTKDLPTATDGLKHKLQKARGQVRELPDIQRSVKDQEEEIERLEERIRRQKEVLGQLRVVGESARRERELQVAGKVDG